MSGFFYNPNIHPFSEYQNRKKAVEEYSKSLGMEMFYPEYLPQDFFRVVNQQEHNPGRCALCWELRLKKTALTAKEKGFTHFSTTLLVSPYQDQNLLQGIGERIEEEENINFYFEDFRTGFKKAHDQARQKGIYCQKYCGCIYSELERCKKSGNR